MKSQKATLSEKCELIEYPMKRIASNLRRISLNPSMPTEDLRLANSIAIVPTETVEGYAVALKSKKAILDLMELKSRNFDSGKVFTLVPESKSAIPKYALIPDVAKPIIEQYIPGEITLILPKNPDFHHFYYDHFSTIGIRIPDHPLFPKLLKVNGALILTSANPRGGTPKSCNGHLPSTIIDFTNPSRPKILREGNLHLPF